MSKVNKTGQDGPFYKLDKRRQKAVMLLFEDELTDEEIAKSVQRSRSTLSSWKNEELFKAAQKQYRSLVVKNDYESKALKKLKELLEAKSEMVQLQSATTILKMAGMLSDSDTPELTRAKVRKANADARVAEARAKSLEENGADVEVLIDKMLTTIERKDSEENAN
ncbi:phBC6A51 family helix-turn-helix protein [Limosilactobacillus mucosae]|jgi:transposase-like protein|uniref:Helix-turn-helix of insertion element transposase n=1 Tax=Myoviridae sp. cte0p10 TaxID=2826674 RepID=A0A8S5NG34_9CAUD|nr:phBC6A51 family helix-turn-helix protein [Limosilactobacillus mucosae]DAD93282.1 MAG TPA: Helix-turn-helix of insertion element transposase [Myoviridae sp. cte0p10]